MNQSDLRQSTWVSRDEMCSSADKNITKGRGATPRPFVALVLTSLALGAALFLIGGYPLRTARAQTGDIIGPTIAAPAIPSAFDGNVRDLPRTPPKDRGEQLRPRRFPRQSVPTIQLRDPVVQALAVKGKMPTPGTSFKGLDRQSWGSGVPPDANGDVGPHHYIQTVNTSIGIFSKTGTQLAAFTFNAFWASADTGTPCDHSHQGDPIVLYDPSASRWLIADLAWTSFTNGPFYLCVAISKAADPLTGGWWLYSILADSEWFVDYPKFGVWRDGYYASANLFDTRAGDVYKGVRVWALDRTALTLGQRFSPISFDLPCTVSACYANLLPSNFRGALPPNGSPNFFGSIDQPNLFHLWKFHADWNAPLSSTFTGPTDLTTANFSMPCSAGLMVACIPEKNGEWVDGLGDRLMMSLQYRRLSGGESLWVNHTVAASSAVGVPTGIRWYEIRDPNGTPTIYQQSTFQPDSNYRWMGSLAVDRRGNMVLGYSVSSATMVPAIRYAGRLANDPPGQLSQGEAVLIQGTGAQSGGANRWGDYSAMTSDPVDDCTFWYTNEYYQVTGSNWLTRIGSFKFPTCFNSPSPTPTPTQRPTPEPSSTPISCSRPPARPKLRAPHKSAIVYSRQVLLDWTDVNCATRYMVIVKRGSPLGKVVERQRKLTQSQYTTLALKRNRTYFWRVRACNKIGCSSWTIYRKFTVSPNAAGYDTRSA